MQEIIYRELNAADLYEYRRIRLESLANYPDHFGATYDEEFHSSASRLEPVVKNQLKNSFAIGAFVSVDKLVGICGFLAEQQSKKKHRGEIVQFYVDPAHARKGIGKNLLKLCVQKTSDFKIEQIVLSATSTNDCAINLYKKLGFVQYGRLDHYFRSPSGYHTQLLFVLNKLKQVI